MEKHQCVPVRTCPIGCQAALREEIGDLQELLDEARMTIRSIEEMCLETQ